MPRNASTLVKRRVSSCYRVITHFRSPSIHKRAHEGSPFRASQNIRFQQPTKFDGSCTAQEGLKTYSLSQNQLSMSVAQLLFESQIAASSTFRVLSSFDQLQHLQKQHRHIDTPLLYSIIPGTCCTIPHTETKVTSAEHYYLVRTSSNFLPFCFSVTTVPGFSHFQQICRLLTLQVPSSLHLCQTLNTRSAHNYFMFYPRNALFFLSIAALRNFTGKQPHFPFSTSPM